jgi:hypothetical protein
MEQRNHRFNPGPQEELTVYQITRRRVPGDGSRYSHR